MLKTTFSTNNFLLNIENFLTPPSTELSPFMMADTQLKIANGIDLTYKKGVVAKDLGYSKVGSTLQSGKAITGLHNFRQSSTVQKILATVNNSSGTNLQLMYNNAGTWTNISVGSTYDTFEDALVEMEDFIGYCFIVGYDPTDNVFLPVSSLTGTTFSTSTNVGSMPQGKYIKRYRDRLYVANCYTGATAYPYRVYFSSVPAAGAITWTPASDFIDVDFAEQITGIGVNWDKMVIFTEFSAYIYNQDTKTNPWDIGCINHRTIQNLDAYMIWADKNNVYASTGGRPTPIASDIKELLINADPTVWRSAVVNNKYYLYLGSTDANGLHYTNCMAIFDAELGLWQWREYYDNFTALARFTANSEDYLYMGASDGDVHVKSKWTDTTKIYADDGHAIRAHFRTKAFSFNDKDMPVRKYVEKIIAYCEFGSGLMVRFRIWDRNQEIMMPFTDIGQLGKVVNEFDKKITGNFIQFEFKEYSKNQAFKFYAFSALLGEDQNL